MSFAAIVGHPQFCCIKTLDAQATQNNTRVHLVVTRTQEGNPVDTIPLVVPQDIRAQDVITFLNSTSFQTGGPIYEAQRLVNSMAQVASAIFSKKLTPAYISMMLSITNELSTSSNLLTLAKEGFARDMDSGVYGGSGPSPTRVRCMVQAEAAAQRAEQQIKNVLQSLSTENIITNTQHDTLANLVSFSRFKLNVFVQGFQNSWFI